MIELLTNDWQPMLRAVLHQPHGRALWRAVDDAYAHEIVYPPKDELFTAFTLTPFADVNVVILGQDPYHSAGQAHGLAFSVPDGVAIPPSLRNIYKEILADTGTPSITRGDLSAWATQGVLLLNSTLSVRAGEASSHRHIGWETFTDTIIQSIADTKTHAVFMLWGNHAIRKHSLITKDCHLILTAPHPSPLSAHRGFFGCRHFTKTNQFLISHGKEAIIW
jgi:uracil-DNA glycosylase